MTARWSTETTDQFDREFKKLDRAVQRCVLGYLHDVEGLDDPQQRGKGLTVNHAGVWRYRVGDYRILAQLIDNTLTVLRKTQRRQACRHDRKRARTALPPP